MPSNSLVRSVSSYIARYFTQGHSRTIKAKRNIAALFALRAVSILTNFLLVPLTLNYLNPTRYGIWLTLTSVINWVGILDIGLGNGLRNKFAEALARDDKELARAYVSTTYVFIAVISLAALAIFWLINPFLSWAKILNAPGEMESELSSLAAIVFTFFCLRLVFGLILTVLVADQRPAVGTLLEILTNALTLVCVYILTRL